MFFDIYIFQYRKIDEIVVLCATCTMQIQNKTTLFSLAIGPILRQKYMNVTVKCRTVIGVMFFYFNLCNV